MKKNELPIQLRRLILRDAAELFRVVDANREHLRRWLPWVDACTCAGDSRQFIAEALNQYSRNLGFHCAITVERRIAGVAGFLPIDWCNRSAELGYWLDHCYCGQGLATLAVTQLAAHAFEGYGLDRVELRIAADNWSSRRVAERLHFTLSAHASNVEKLDAGGVDQVVYTMEHNTWCGIRQRPIESTGQ